jgi:hypothetical protein
MKTDKKEGVRKVIKKIYNNQMSQAMHRWRSQMVEIKEA